MRLPSSNIRRLLSYAMAAGFGLGLFVYGFVRLAEQLPGSSPERALIFALPVGALIGLALAVAIKLALRQVAYDLHNHAVDLTDAQIPPPVPIMGDEVVYMRQTLSQALAYVPRPLALPQLASDLAETSDLPEALEALARHMNPHIPVRGAVLLLLDAERGLLYPEAVWGSASLGLDITLDLYETAVGRALRERRIALYSGLQARDLLPLQGGPEQFTLFCLPLMVRAQAFGTLCLVLPGDDLHLNEEQREFARSAADLFTLAAQGGMHRHLFQRESDRMAAFEQLGSLIATSDRLDRALEQVLRVAARVTESAHGSLLLLDSDEARVRLRITLKEGDVLPLSVTAGPILKHGLAGWALRERRADTIDDTERDTRWLPVPGLDSMRSAMVVPLLYGDRALGIMTFADPAPRHYSRRSLALAAALAAHAVTILARMQHDEMVESGTIALVRRIFGGRLASAALAELAADNSLISRLLSPQTGAAVAIYIGIRGLGQGGSQLGPARLLNEVIAPYIGEISTIVYEHHGYVAHRDDGGLLALFGYPIARSDDRVRAVRAALAIQQAARKLRGRWRGLGAGLTISAGMAQGEITAGIIGEEGHQDLILLGEAVRDARRLQQLARADEILVGDPLGAALAGEHSFTLDTLAPLPAANGEQTRTVYRLGTSM